jgi:hypothetical protein
VTESQHAFCAPSDWEGWSNCPGKPALEETEPDVSSPDADFGTAAHAYAANLLRARPADREALYGEVPADMLEGVTLYVEAVLERIAAYKLAGAKRVIVLVEQALDISAITGEKGAKGTADCVLVAIFEDYCALDVWDLKFGIGVVVAVVGNGQLQIYALAALLQHGLVYEIREVNLLIHQPRVHKDPKEWARTPDQLYEFGAIATEKAAVALSLRGEVAALSNLVPGDKQCRFCRVKWRCPELLKSIHAEVYGEFQAVEDPNAVPVPVADRALTLPPARKSEVLGRAMSRVGLIESWCLAVRAACDDAMLNEGLRVPGFKVVQGRKGARKWTDPEAVLELAEASGVERERLLSAPELLSPTQLEKILSNDPFWTDLQTLLAQTEGRPSVAPESDARPPITVAATADEFDPC